jgi:hypothetical protein
VVGHGERIECRRLRPLEETLDRIATVVGERGVSVKLDRKHDRSLERGYKKHLDTRRLFDHSTARIDVDRSIPVEADDD